MSMERINGSPVLQQGILDSARQKDKVETNSKQDAQNADIASTGVAPASGDTAQISDTAHRLMELRSAVDVGRASMAALPEVREDKIAQARERLQSGFYNSAEVRDKIANGVDAVFRGMDKL